MKEQIDIEQVVPADATKNIVHKNVDRLCPKQRGQESADQKNVILVVDDDEAVREVTSEILAGAGYEIFTATDGFSGFDEFSKHSTRIKLVVLDIAMPNIDGEELFRQIRKVAPAVPVIVCSGLQEKIVLNAITPDEFLGKPYDPKLLLNMVTKFLD